MSDKNPRVQIEKAAWTLVEGIKDVVAANVMNAAKSNELGDIKKADLQKLLTLLNGSIDEGNARGSRVFNKSIDSALTDVALPPLKLSAAAQARVIAAKKNNQE